MNPYSVKHGPMGELGREDPGINAIRAAIVALACKDYINALSAPKRQPGSLIGNKAELEAFFLSGWFGMLCPVNGQTLIAELRRRHKQGNRFVYNNSYADIKKEQ